MAARMLMHRSDDGEHYTNSSKKFDKQWLKILKG